MNIAEIGTKTWKKISTKRMLKEWNINFQYSIKMPKKTLKFDNVEVDKKDFHASKQPIALESVLINKIVVPDKFEYSDKNFTDNDSDKDYIV